MIFHFAYIAYHIAHIISGTKRADICVSAINIADIIFKNHTDDRIDLKRKKNYMNNCK